MKYFVKIFLIFIIILKTFGETYELKITNNSSSTIAVAVYPVGCVFNRDFEYKLENRIHYQGYDYVYGSTSPQDLGQNEYIGFEFAPDILIEDPPPTYFGGLIGYGKYRVSFRYASSEIAYCYVDFSDANYPYIGGSNDIVLHIYNGNVLKWEDYPISNGFTCTIWDKTYIGGHNFTQNKSGFKTNSGDNSIWLRFPQIADEYPYNAVAHESPQKLLVYLKTLTNHNAQVRSSEIFQITNSNYLQLETGSTLTVKGGGYLVVDGGALFRAIGGASCTFESYSELYLKKNSVLNFSYGQIYFQPRSIFCDAGATIYGQSNILFKGLIFMCEPEEPDVSLFKDSVKIILEDTATLNIPDSSTWIFEGTETALLCDSGSTIKFGKGSKLVFTDGARINAKYTKFTTYDSNTTWNGIYLNDVSYDTLQYCTIENALNGINIEDKYSLFTGAPATEISNCEFSNKTSEQLLNMVYVNNSANVMIRNCTSSSLVGDGFASGVIVEYCSAGGVNVIDNEISNVITGINIIQSSPHIARNTVTGTGSSGTGIYLDNSNGTIEYNTVNNFEKSTVLYYSSPYVLKNTFSDANSVCAHVTAYSTPVMKPIASGSTLRWLGGNNHFTGQPSTAGITLENEGHPLMDSGYNVINVGNSYYMQGTISRVLYMRVNNWYDNPPESQKFDISGEEYDYSEYFDGQTIPPTDYYELNSIGFGYFDTVYVDEMEGDNFTAEDIFILAYRKEMERKFVEAVALYKNVITNFNTSNYATTSLSRIFNCLEKSNAGINQYSAVKSYYDGIKNSNTYPQRLREHAEDLAIKAKVRMGFIEEAISDYQTIINNNGNNPKGLHAQVNKLVLMNMNSGDIMAIGNKQTAENYKANLLSLITGKNIHAQNRFVNNIPGQFKLYQNYPNPFNPKTSIKYDLPQHAQVTLTIYDITGRVILSIYEFKQAGRYSHTFDGSNYASGLYFYRLVTPDFTQSKKMLLVK